jgi:hypothetical protein
VVFGRRLATPLVFELFFALFFEAGLLDLAITPPDNGLANCVLAEHATFEVCADSTSKPGARA